MAMLFKNKQPIISNYHPRSELMVRFYFAFSFNMLPAPPPVTYIYTQKREKGIENKFNLFQYDFEGLKMSALSIKGVIFTLRHVFKLLQFLTRIKGKTLSH